MSKKAPTATLALVLVTAAWGLTFTVIKDAVRELSPLTFVAIRFLIAAVLLGAYVWVKDGGQSPKLTSGELRAGVLLGLYLFLGYAFQTVGLQFTSASSAGFITGMAVVLVPVISLFTNASPIKWNSWLGVVLSLFGLGLLSAFNGSGVNGGDLLVLACSVAFAFHIVYVGKYTARYDPVRLTWLQITACGVLSVLAALAFEYPGLRTLPVMLLHPRVIGALLFCALIATAAAFLIQNVFQKHSTPVRTALIFTCEPVVSALFAYLLAGETLLARQVVGCVFLLFGMLSAELGEALVLYYFRGT